MGDNGEPKTPEQERLERYQKDPESFTENSELVVGVRRGEKGLSYLLQGNEQELNLCFSELTRKIMNVLNLIEATKQQNANKIIKPHSVLDFVRRRK